ncbi:MAG: ArsR family transcriptional regulator [Nitrososphaerota archaeon]|nr:ArsR family transcriptional regulator [Nitrososphaerota archaeon]MDG6949825.1 ArsR family transcriptional regulator [Nitrososphaerota archaeon]
MRNVTCPKCGHTWTVFGPTKTLILHSLFERPRTWTELLTLTQVSEPVLNQHLHDLQAKHLIIRIRLDQDSRYRYHLLSESGRII